MHQDIPVTDGLDVADFGDKAIPLDLGDGKWRAAPIQAALDELSRRIKAGMRAAFVVRRGPVLAPQYAGSVRYSTSA